ncbi:motile sperm domain-containing protein 2 [Dermatophagoides farinae]|uniref:Motile sperm domain containing 2-like protein n=2 Tax=Dermatophagoides farinae TaxID=6954 RepID=A0A922I948_DERFA|nr:phosphatidylinositol transfer protein CSR1-like [Dermatophagoides farinae]KAH7639189.1 motile sperm domain containing 2-like protein [Dermatophagoides farinae]KAH9522269.1 Motile sperm domain-containing protein 2 [Dermatophagoides farinae]
MPLPPPSEAILKKIERLRARFEKELETNSHLYHPIDIERVRTEEWQVERFAADDIYELDNDDGPFKAMCEALQWKKTLNVHERTEKSFPKEFYELIEVEINGRDNEGHLIQWEATRNQRKFKELEVLTREFMAFSLERLDRAAGRDGFVYVTDNGGAGLANVDMDMNKFKISAIEHYPGGMRKMYVVDLPWLLNGIMSMILAFMSPRLRALVHYCKKTDLPKFMDVKHISLRLNGTRDKHAYPSDTRRLEEMTELGLDEKFLDSFYKTYKLKRTMAK